MKLNMRHCLMKGGDTMRHKDDACMDSRIYNCVQRYLMKILDKM